MADDCREGGVRSYSGGGDSSGGNRHLSPGGFTTGNYFWFVINLLLPNAWMAIPPVSALTSLCWPTTKPPFLHTSACLIMNLAPQPSQQRGRSTNPNLYLRRILSLYLFLLRDMPFTVVGWTETHQAPVLVLRVALRASSASMGTRREESVVAELACFVD